MKQALYVLSNSYFTVTGLHKPLDFLFIWLYVLRTNEWHGKIDIVLVEYRLLWVTLAAHGGHLAIPLSLPYRVMDFFESIY